MTHTSSHIATRQVQAPPESAFRFLCDPIALGRWSLGCFDTAPAGDQDGLYTGRSLIDGSQAWFRIDADSARYAMDFLVGTPEQLVRRISARVLPGVPLGYPDGTCLVSLIAWRTAGMSDERWQRVQALHDAEIILIAGQIEQVARGAR